MVDRHEDVDSQKAAWFHDRGMEVPKPDDKSNDDDTAALSEDAHASIEQLAEHYDIEQLDKEFVDEEIESLSTKVEALTDRCPRHCERLSRRLLALQAVRPAFKNQYADTSNWEALEANGNFD